MDHPKCHFVTNEKGSMVVVVASKWIQSKCGCCNKLMFRTHRQRDDGGGGEHLLHTATLCADKYGKVCVNILRSLYPTHSKSVTLCGFIVNTKSQNQTIYQINSPPLHCVCQENALTIMVRKHKYLWFLCRLVNHFPLISCHLHTFKTSCVR
jgi:hypothetical protein